MPELRTIAVGVDGSPASQRALETAIDFAKLATASLTVVGVVPIGVVYTDQAGAVLQVLAENRKYFEELLAGCAATARRAGLATVQTETREGAIVEQLLAFLDEHHPDLMVLGARGLSATRRILLGSVSDGVVHHAASSILIVRAPQPPGAGTPPSKPGKDGASKRRA